MSCDMCDASVPAPGMASSAARQARRARIDRALRRGVGVQYWGRDYDAAALARAPHGLLVIEATRVGAPDSDSGREIHFPPEAVREIRDDGERIALGYVNVGEIETYRDYWSDAVRADAAGRKEAFAWRGPKSNEGELLAKYWTPQWEEILFARVDRIMAQGYDGVFLDDVLHYFTFAAGLLAPGSAWSDSGAPSGATGFARAMMRLVRKVADRARAHDREALVVVNNGGYIGRDAGADRSGAGPSAFDIYRAGIDGVLVENMFAPNASPEALTVIGEDYQSRGVRVLTVDFVSRFPGMSSGQVRDEVTSRARRRGFAPYVADDDRFDRLYEPITDR